MKRLLNLTLATVFATAGLGCQACHWLCAGPSCTGCSDGCSTGGSSCASGACGDGAPVYGPSVSVPGTMEAPRTYVAPGPG